MEFYWNTRRIGYLSAKGLRLFARNSKKCVIPEAYYFNLWGLRFGMTFIGRMTRVKLEK